MAKIDWVVLNVTCPFCAGCSEVLVSAESLEAFRKGALIQDAFRNSPPGALELILTGICVECQEGVFRED